MSDHVTSVGVPPAPKRRVCWLHVTEEYILHQFGLCMRETFPTAKAILHVGSSVTGPGWRDVDIRIVLDNYTYNELALITDTRALNVALSVWGQQFTRLPIDCQVQSDHEHRDHTDQPARSIGGLPR